MKKVFDNRQVTHVWAAQTQSEGRNVGNSIYFKGDTIWSYGNHFPMGKIYTKPRGMRVAKKFALLNSASYNVTTSKHQSYTISAVSGRMRYHFVPDVQTPDAEVNFEKFENAIADYIADILNPRKLNVNIFSLGSRVGWYNEFLNDIGSKKIFKLDDITLEILREICQEKAAKNETKNAAKKLKQEQERALRAIKYKDQIKLWVTHSNTESIPRDVWPYDVCRVTKEGSEIETSAGARVPLRKSKFALEMLDKGHAITGLHLGHFTIESEPDTEGFVKIGCHRINVPQVREMLKNYEEKLNQTEVPF